MRRKKSNISFRKLTTYRNKKTSEIKKRAAKWGKESSVLLYKLISGSCNQIWILSSISLLRRFCLLSSQSKPINHFKLVYWWNIYSNSRNAIPTNSLNQMLLNKLFITKVQHEHTCSNITSTIYSRSKNNCFEGHVLAAAFKHDENCPITFIPSTSPCHILSYSNSARKSIIGEINFFRGKPGCKNW